MGNCCRHESSATMWASVNELYGYEYPSSMEKYSLIVVSGAAINGAASTTFKEHRVIKSKVMNRELEEMVEIGRAQDVLVDQVLSRLIQAVNHSDAQSQRSWEPVLDTITE